MHIEFIEIANFRKLLSIRVDITEETTLFVGANNSGKTSAMAVLQKFLAPGGDPFNLYDFLLSHWTAIDAIGQEWIAARDAKQVIEYKAAEWASVVPTLDLWLHVESGEFHQVSAIIPSLDWEGGRLGVRLRYEPSRSDRKGPPAEGREALCKAFLAAHDAAEKVRATHNAAEKVRVADTNASPEKPNKLTVWPTSLSDFLRRHLKAYFKVRAYLLDPAAIKEPEPFQACPQVLDADALPVDGDPLGGLIRVDNILAQRNFADAESSSDDKNVSTGRTLLSTQLSDYYDKHLDPSDQPEPKDLDALQALEAAQVAFDERLEVGFDGPFKELEDMGYPGVTDPRPKISTRLKISDGIDHPAAVSFEITGIGGSAVAPLSLRLPEDRNGLGYQNLIWMTFKLIQARDAWMRVGKARKPAGEERFEPLHLVMIEEPEAHLHAQVQQVFIKNAYKVLRNHTELGNSTRHRTQLIVSTHSSHIAHEVKFDRIRYFRRLPAGMLAKIPVSTVVNLSEAFGPKKATERFVTRYLQARHADLFFADAAILVEGPAERMLLPHFIRAKHDFLDRCFVTILEIGGSHAHRLRGLIEKLGLLTLVVTDLDSFDVKSRKSAPPARGADQITKNPTLRKWLPGLSTIDDLYAAGPDKKIKIGDELFSVRVAYQTPLNVTVPKTGNDEEARPYTFEDALAFENLGFFKRLKGGGMAATFRKAITTETTAVGIGQKMFDALDGKAEFVLRVIGAEKFDDLNVPTYIREGLEWLEVQLDRNQREILPPTGAPEPAP